MDDVIDVPNATRKNALFQMYIAVPQNNCALVELTVNVSMSCKVDYLIVELDAVMF